MPRPGVLEYPSYIDSNLHQIVSASNLSFIFPECQVVADRCLNDKLRIIGRRMELARYNTLRSFGDTYSIGQATVTTVKRDVRDVWNGITLPPDYMVAHNGMITYYLLYRSAHCSIFSIAMPPKTRTPIQNAGAVVFLAKADNTLSLPTVISYDVTKDVKTGEVVDYKPTQVSRMIQGQMHDFYPSSPTISEDPTGWFRLENKTPSPITVVMMACEDFTSYPRKILHDNGITKSFINNKPCNATDFMPEGETRFKPLEACHMTQTDMHNNTFHDYRAPHYYYRPFLKTDERPKHLPTVKEILAHSRPITVMGTKPKGIAKEDAPPPAKKSRLDQVMSALPAPQLFDVSLPPPNPDELFNLGPIRPVTPPPGPTLVPEFVPEPEEESSTSILGLDEIIDFLGVDLDEIPE